MKVKMKMKRVRICVCFCPMIIRVVIHVARRFLFVSTACRYFVSGVQVFVGLHLLVTRQEGVLYLKDTGVLVQEIASVRVRAEIRNVSRLDV